MEEKTLNDVIFYSSGRIEGKYYQCENPRAPAALILSPHPLYGGSMNNKVIYRIFDACVRGGFSALRFNFRGVGQSHGSFDNGVGELLDAATALDWLQNSAPEASAYWIMGFSFGSWIGMQLLMRRPEVSGFIIIAPPTNSYDFSFVSPCPTSGLIIQGTKDEIVPEQSVYKLWENLSNQKEVDYQLIEANHMFDGKLNELSDILVEYMKKSLDDNRFGNLIEGKKRDRRRRYENNNLST
ncbi:alpha/beta hydrolase [Lyticum sinuosum]|uniref:Alpha/beta hydrolase family protein n=1 Tax=Lyticum sinuosum TaxID=1332059 RepID=A0AAE4VKB2_9RICK|nr:alpha/beta hydrolase [Lyticum sinuosum]MDZ5761560.1 Alpha/beta hydrolase family protein [Lyticum sinuosum]